MKIFDFLNEVKFYLKIFIKKKTLNRITSNVKIKYENVWGKSRSILENCSDENKWIKRDLNFRISNYKGNLRYKNFDFIDYNINKINNIVRNEFSGVKSITEFGSGLGKNLIRLKKILPQIKYYGYELTESGVEISNLASKKFNLDIEYSQLDFVNDDETKFIFPKSNLGVTLFALEQISDEKSIKLGIENILKSVTHGSIHIEPVLENYPDNIHGFFCKKYHRNHDYLKNFEEIISKIKNISYKKIVLNCSGNPFMCPSLYIIKKHNYEN